MGLCILTGHIVWIIGGYPCGAYLDLHIFREGLSEILEVGETVIADGRYKREEHIYVKGYYREASLTDASARVRYEKLNSCLKM